MLCVSVPVVVDERVSKQTIKPCHDGFTITYGVALIDGLDERCLQNVLGVQGVSQTTLEKCLKLPVVLDQRLDELR